MKLSYPLSTVAALSAADAHILGFQHGGCAPCAASNSPSSTSLDMRRRQSPMMRSFMGPPLPRSMFSEIEQMNELMERQFNEFFDTPMMLRPTAPSPFISARRARDALMLPDRAAAFRRPTYQYRIDEEEGKYTLSVDLPGVKASDVAVSLEQDGRVLRINGMRQEKNGDMAYESKFSKDFVLNKDVHVEGVDAKLADGVMTIVAPKKPKVEPKSISIPIKEEVPEVAEPTVEEETAKVDDNTKIETTEEGNVEMKTDADATPNGEVVDLDEKKKAPVEAAKADTTPDE
eukprot:CAMPEP_0197715920 /NCGR_PEP_ID=MMETSP1434-20131217/982_1 /TAXON_ID=265543 /ORGANISM="Minutocellus polymorphus, Strain CCMP3303" /LENGTH=288 /DNA_ID=CAMNT_0043300183 /DNA_START=27 /DNA_END=893 /DNA_ORIENTATION=-